MNVINLAPKSDILKLDISINYLTGDYVMRKLLVVVLVIIVTVGVFPFSQVNAQSVENGATNPIETAFVGHGSCGGVTLQTPQTPECDALIATRPVPNVTTIPTDYGVVADETFIRFNKNRVPVYDAPEGSRVDTLITGYTYVTPLAFQDGYAQLSSNRWISMEDARISRPSALSGVTIQSLDMPFAWILWNHNAADAPAGVRNTAKPLRRYQLVNIYATVNVRGWNWHLIGPNMWTNQQNLSIVFPSAPASFGGRWVGVNLYEQNLVAYEGATPVFAALVSSGVKNGRWDTHTGTFTIHTRVEAGTMNGAEGQADFYSLEKVPYAQYFDNLISLHGTYWHDSFGYPHSHGCVNLSVTDAKWVYENWLTVGSTVFVYEGE
jgi:hypothetical protein